MPTTLPCICCGRNQQSLTVQMLNVTTNVVSTLAVGPQMTAGQQADIEESGWKMVSGDVFRTPKEPLLLCVEVGSGVQICSSAFITLLFAALGKHTDQEHSVKQDTTALRLG